MLEVITKSNTEGDERMEFIFVPFGVKSKWRLVNFVDQMNICDFRRGKRTRACPIPSLRDDLISATIESTGHSKRHEMRRSGCGEEVTLIGYF